MLGSRPGVTLGMTLRRELQIAFDFVYILEIGIEIVAYKGKPIPILQPIMTLNAIFSVFLEDKGCRGTEAFLQS